VCLDGNRYSAPNEYLDKELTLKETMDTITLMGGRHELCVHGRIPEGERGESRLPGHGRDLTQRRSPSTREPSMEEVWIAAQPGMLTDYVKGLKRLGSRRSPHQIRKLYALCHEYEVAEVEKTACSAAAYGLFDVTRLESMLLHAHGARLFGQNNRGSGDGQDSATPAVSPVISGPEPDADVPSKELGEDKGEPSQGDDDDGA